MYNPQFTLIFLCEIDIIFIVRETYCSCYMKKYHTKGLLLKINKKIKYL